MIIFKKLLTNSERAWFVLGVVVGAAGALSGTFLDRDLESESRNAARAQLAHAETQEQWLERECLINALAKPRSVPDADLPSDCSSVVAKLRAAAFAKSPHQ
ncbi:hypothetical protein [Burkholderia cenocepacia]|uniref:hypothetical protein n=1 Tax=Burkholderia cenocepacia TaxID=95486 RepID=UPI002B24820C|nr:hypothetical protein [Burkholderia cenocepacia]MEB2558813.1 hypothetical protein [Burkholderia cenocepacia]